MAATVAPSGSRLREIKTFPSLVKYLRDELDWPIESDDFEDVTFDWQPEELGIDPENAAKIQEIKQLRPLADEQPWGIFFIKFEPRKLPVVALRRILRALVVRKRGSAKKAQQKSWELHDLLFISLYGTSEHREIAFAHFAEEPNLGDLPTLRVLGWDDENTPLHLEHADHELREKLKWPDDESKLGSWRRGWSSAFALRHGEVIRTAKAMAERLAELASRIRKRVNTVLRIESDKGPLRLLHKSFREALIHDLSEDDFADMYAQTISYGLLTARISRPAGIIGDNLRDMVPVTNPFLRDLLETFLTVGGRKGKIEFDELGVSEVVQMLRDAHMEDVLRDFGDRNPQEDPAIHFYELFLKEYDPEKRVRRGVFYTPRPVVSYIVRSVHELLQSAFGLPEGLASTATWAEMAKRYPGLEIPKGTAAGLPFVQILDPAVGTGTFLVEVIDVVHKTMLAKWRKEDRLELETPKLWNEYVSKHLLPRLHGYELMMAPYAIAHMKIGLKLHETGYRFGSDERARIYLTNSLEPPHDFSERLAFDAPALAHEASAVNEVKSHQRFTVVVGNPPYSHMSANLGDTVRRIVDIYREVDGKTIQERGAIMFERTLQDDYVKFHALADRLTQGFPAVRAYITNSAYLDNPTLRGMRYYLTKHWPASWVLDLHGDTKRADGSDENVFDIRTGVAIGLFVRPPSECLQNIAAFAELKGARTQKYSILAATGVGSTTWVKFTPRSPSYLLRPLSEDGESELSTASQINDAFTLKSEAIKTNRDHFVIGESNKEILERIQVFINPAESTKRIKEILLLNDNAQWTVESARRECRETYNASNVTDIAYRPFDDRRIYYHPSVVFSPRPVLEENVLDRENLVFLTCRRIRTGRHAHFFVTNKIAVKEMLSSADNCNAYPLYRFEKYVGKVHRLPNFTAEFLETLASRLSLAQPNGRGVPDGLTPEDILHYIYAVFYSPNYRSRYAAFLQNDFPRLPLTRDLDLFRALARLGRELVATHLLESPKLNQQITKLVGAMRTEVEKIVYEDRTVWIDKEQTSGFRGVPEAVWKFQIGSYQVCEKWLKDRKGRKLLKDDLEHYQRIVVALAETIRLMKEIDEVIEKHGGWPDAFSTGSAESAKTTETRV